MEYYLDQVQDIFYINPLGSEQPTYDQDNVPFKHEIIPFFYVCQQIHVPINHNTIPSCRVLDPVPFGDIYSQNVRERHISLNKQEKVRNIHQQNIKNPRAKLQD